MSSVNNAAGYTVLEPTRRITSLLMKANPNKLNRTSLSSSLTTVESQEEVQQTATQFTCIFTRFRWPHWALSYCLRLTNRSLAAVCSAP